VYTKASHKGNRYEAVHHDGGEMINTKWGKD
jgi:hypothetical protein